MVVPLFGGDPDRLVQQGTDDSSEAVVIAALPSRAVTHVGTCRIGRDIRVKIDLRNALGSPLNLRSIDPDCGCLEVMPEQRHMKPGGNLTLSLKLESSNKIATVRRSIRIFFQESNHPFVLDIDVRMTGPLHLVCTTVRLADPDASFTVLGGFEKVGGQVQKIKSLRGSFVISDSLVQNSQGFKFHARPTFSFGDADDLVRVHYRNPMGDVQVVDLPLRLRFTTPLRFLPSTMHLDSRSAEWVGTARMIVVPGSLKIPLKQLTYFVESKSRPGQSPYEVAVSVRAVSSIMSVIEVVITEDRQVADRDAGLFPDRLLVHGPNKKVVGVLNLVREGEH